LTCGLGDLFPGIGCLSSGKTRKFGATVGKRSCDEYSAEAVKAVEESRVRLVPSVVSISCMEAECTGIYLPVAGADVASIIGRHATTIDDDSENHEAGTCDDLKQAESKFDLAA
jgi:hypothetical protein